MLKTEYGNMQYSKYCPHPSNMNVLSCVLPSARAARINVAHGYDWPRQSHQDCTRAAQWVGHTSLSRFVSKSWTWHHFHVNKNVSRIYLYYTVNRLKCFVRSLEMSCQIIGSVLSDHWKCVVRSLKVCYQTIGKVSSDHWSVLSDNWKYVVRSLEVCCQIIREVSCQIFVSVLSDYSTMNSVHGESCLHVFFYWSGENVAFICWFIT